jgi:hypothetical protein
MPQKECLNIIQVWESLLVQLAKENNKFIFSHVAKDKRAADLEGALIWLEGAGMCRKLILLMQSRISHPGNMYYGSFRYFLLFPDVFTVIFPWQLILHSFLLGICKKWLKTEFQPLFYCAKIG